MAYLIFIFVGEGGGADLRLGDITFIVHNQKSNGGPLILHSNEVGICAPYREYEVIVYQSWGTG